MTNWRIQHAIKIALDTFKFCINSFHFQQSSMQHSVEGKRKALFQEAVGSGSSYSLCTRVAPGDVWAGQVLGRAQLGGLRPSPHAWCSPVEGAEDRPSLLYEFASPAENSRVRDTYPSAAPPTLPAWAAKVSLLLMCNYISLSQSRLLCSGSFSAPLSPFDLGSLREVTYEVTSHHCCLWGCSSDVVPQEFPGDLVNGQILIQQDGRGARGWCSCLSPSTQCG